MMIVSSDRQTESSFIFDTSNENELKKKDSPKKQSVESKTGDSIMNNETFSFKLGDGMYMANFGYTPSSRVGNQLLFKGMLDGRGNFIGRHCIVRTNLFGTKESWQDYVDVRKKLESIGDIFRANKSNCTFSVPKSALANMDRTAFPSKIFSRFGCWHRPKEDDFVLVDLYRRPCEETIHTGQLFSAISHISLKQSHGQSYLTNFRAFNYNGGKVCITNADTSTDVAAFERRHVCNKLCEMEILSPSVVIPDTGSDSYISQPYITRQASAPPIGDIYVLGREPIPPFWSCEPIPPPYSKHPPPSAPPISYEYSEFQFPSDFFLRQFSVS